MLFCETSSGFELDNIKNAAILRDFLNVWTWQRQKRSNPARLLLQFFKVDNWQHQKRSNSARLPQCLNLTTSKTKQFCETSSFFKVDNWQHQKRSNSARLPQCLNLTTSKTKQFCETSSFFEVDSIKNERILRDFFQKWKVECRADNLVPMRFAIFPVHLSKVLRLPRKSDARLRSAAPVTQNHLSKPEDLILQNATPLRKSAPGPPNSSDGAVHLCRSSSNVPRLPSFVEMLQNPHVLLCFAHFWQGPQSLAPVTRHDIWTSKSGVFNILTSKCASGHKGVHFFDISTSKSGPKLVCFLHCDFEMCFGPQRRALFRHLNFQKWSGAEVLCTFWLGNLLRTTTACTFSTSQLPKVFRTWGVLNFFAGRCASRHNGVQFFISHLARWLRIRRFSKPTFRPSGATNHIGKTQCFAASRLSYLFAHLHLLSSYSFSLIFSLLLFSFLWVFPSLLFICPYCRKFDF